MTEQIKGLKGLKKSLDDLETKVNRKITRRGIAKMAQVIRKDMRKRAPRKTGKLRKSIRYKIKPRKDRYGWTGKVGLYRDGFYGAFLEYGAAPHKQKNVTFKGKVYSEIDHPGIKPKPFLRPGYEASKNEAIKQAGDVMWKLIKEAVR